MARSHQTKHFDLWEQSPRLHEFKEVDPTDSANIWQPTSHLRKTSRDMICGECRRMPSSAVWTSRKPSTAHWESSKIRIQYFLGYELTACVRHVLREETSASHAFISCSAFDTSERIQHHHTRNGWALSGCVSQYLEGKAGLFARPPRWRAHELESV